jgi:NAD(P)-dependent dehydrogenase (short-subunit alcohol dehydrogenase family)
VLALAARRECSLHGAHGSLHRTDLSDPAEALTLAEEVLERHGRVDVLVLNAGTRVDGTIGDVPLEALDASFQVNVISPFVLAGRLAPRWRRAAKASSRASSPRRCPAGGAGMGAYAASKAGLESLTQTLRQEVGGKGVAVFGFDPGWVRTDLAPDGPEEPGAAADRLVAHLEAAKGSRAVLS